MARTDALHRAAHNTLLDVIAGTDDGKSLPSETQLSETLGVSRTVVRSALRSLQATGVLRLEGRDKTRLRAPRADDRLPEREAPPRAEDFEARFLDWILRFDVPAGTPLNLAQLAKQFAVPPHALQPFLSGLVQFGLVERRPRGGWRLLGFTADYAVELSEVRVLFELNAVRVAVRQPEDHPIWTQLRALEMRHRALLARIETDFHDFSRLDEQFHATLGGVVRNRFHEQIQRVISLIFHYHYQWDKTRERWRNEAAIREHLALIEALRRRDAAGAEAAATAHLATAKETLLASLRGHHHV